jgi:hypothetical protein
MRVLLVLVLLCSCATQPPPVIVTPQPRLDWRTRVEAAKALTDVTARNDAMLALMREALDPHEVQMSGTSNATNVDPDDNQPAPILNFDPLLNEKQSAAPRSGGPTRSLKNNFGYYFSYQGKGYVVLGPASLDRRDPVFTQLAAEHELYHAMNHVGDGRPLNDRELETWSKMFVVFFPRVHQYRQQWAPMLNYYDDASEPERAAAMERLVSLYQRSDSAIRNAFEEWLIRRREDRASSQMVSHLSAALGWQSTTIHQNLR